MSLCYDINTLALLIYRHVWPHDDKVHTWQVIQQSCYALSASNRVLQGCTCDCWMQPHKSVWPVSTKSINSGLNIQVQRSPTYSWIINDLKKANPHLNCQQNDWAGWNYSNKTQIKQVPSLLLSELKQVLWFLLTEACKERKYSLQFFLRAWKI